MNEYRTVIVDELGDIKYFCCEITEEKEMEILETHPEWYRTTVFV